MSIARSFSNFLELTRDDQALFDLGEPEFRIHTLGMIEIGPIVITGFSDYSAIIRHRKEYFLADNPDEVGDVMVYLAQQHPYLSNVILNMKLPVAEAKS